MRYCDLKAVLLFLLSSTLILNGANGAQQNKTSHNRRASSGDRLYGRKPLFRSFEPVKYHKNYARADERNDYDLNSYDTEYGAVVSNFTSSIYDENPPLYPNPEILARNRPVMSKTVEKEVKLMETEVEIPDDSLADGDLKEHNIIDSVTYLYGFNGCHSVRNEWTTLNSIASMLAIFMLSATVMWLMWSDFASDFRKHSQLYPIHINLCICLSLCAVIYVQAIIGVSSPSQCERLALLLHYTHVCCAAWIVALAAAVAEHASTGTLLPLKYNYLLAYGAPAVVVMFNYAMSMEQYEIKHYCWMSIEKGMVMGFMVPAMILIVINTCICILGLQSVNKKQAEMLSSKIQEIVDHHIANWPKNEPMPILDNRNGSIDTLDNIYSPSSSRKNTDSSDTLDKEYSEDDCNYVNIGLPNGDANNEDTNRAKIMQDKGLLNMLYMDNLSGKWSWNSEGNDLKCYLNLCLVLMPFFSINWVMGVVAIENATHWSTPTIYLILVIAMHVYLCATICTTLPIIGRKDSNPEPCCEEIIADPTLARTRTTDSIPLLDPAHIQQSTQTPAPADTISTISI